jgi:DNA-binding transcriptional LysR family regulator
MKEPWMLPRVESVVGSLIAEAFRARGLEYPRPSVTTISFQLYSALMAEGHYLGVLPGSVLRFSGKRLALKPLPVELGVPRWPITIGTLKKRTVSPVAQLFIECAREIAKPLAKDK